MKKVLFPLVALVACVFLMAGCSGGQQQPTTNQTTDATGLNTVILMEQDDDMLNTYTLIAVNPDAPFVNENGEAVKDVKINAAGAQALIEWMLSDEGMKLISEYGVEQYGDQLFYLKDDAPTYSGTIAPATKDTAVIRLSTTTSVKDSGLLDAILPTFEQKYGYTVEVQSAGTGKAIAAAEYGNADVILVHAKAKEEDFVKAGYAATLDGFNSPRLSFMYNYFVLCGPSEDPAGVKNCANVKDAFAAIAEGKYPFVSRGDGSGTHTKELTLWPQTLGITEEPESFAPYADWYISANAGMGSCLMMAEEKHAYILTDKATYLTFVANNGKME